MGWLLWSLASGLQLGYIFSGWFSDRGEKGGAGFNSLSGAETPSVSSQRQRNITQASLLPLPGLFPSLLPILNYGPFHVPQNHRQIIMKAETVYYDWNFN